MHGDRDAEGGQAGHDILGGGFDISGVFALQGRKPFDQRPGVVNGGHSNRVTHFGSEHGTLEFG